MFLTFDPKSIPSVIFVPFVSLWFITPGARTYQVRRLAIDTGAAATPRDEEAHGAPFPDDDTLAAIEGAAREFIAGAARIVLERYGGPLDIDYKQKGQRDPVTEVDRAVETYLTEAVTARFPDHAVLGEEGQEVEGETEYEWIVDPVDGTLNFINRLPFFAISIGVLHHRRPVVGVIHFPVTGETLHARRGGGAFRDDEPIRVGPATAPGPNVLAALSVGFWFAFKLRGALRRNFGEPRNLGSIVYEMGLTATGAFHYALFRGPKVWDVAAGVLIVKEAGGVALRYSRSRGGWFPIQTFVAPPPSEPGKPRSLRRWGGPVLVGAAPVVYAIAPNLTPRYAPVALRAAMRRYQHWRKIARAAKDAVKARRAAEAGEGAEPDAGPPGGTGSGGAAY